MWKTVAMAVVAVLVPILFLLLLGTKEQEKIPVSYRIIEDDKAIDSSINPYMLGKDLVIEYKSSVKPRVEGSVNYTVLDDRVIVYNYSNQRFRLIFGNSSDIYEFGETTALLGEFVEERRIEIELQDYIDRYLNWTFTEINSTHWYANFTFNTTVYNDIKACYSKKCTDKCWASIQANYFPEYNVSKVCNDIKNLTNYPYQNLTEGVKIDKINIDTNAGTGSFYLIFPYGFRKGERAKFGFDSTVISTGTTVPWYTNERSICKDGKGYLHVVWLYNSTSIYYARSTDGGSTWSINKTFYGATSTATSTKYTPVISCDGNNITVAYEDYTADDLIIGISTDNGATWIWMNPITSCVESNSYAVERRGQRIYVIYITPATSACGYKDVYFFNSTDGGATWGPLKKLWDGSYSAISGITIYEYYYEPALAVDGTGGITDRIYVAVRHKHYDNIEGVGYEESTIRWINSMDSGKTWGSEKEIVLIAGSPPPYTFNYPSITFNDSNIYLAYSSTNLRVYFNYSSDYGATWTGLRLDTSAKAQYPSVTIDDKGYPWVFYQDSSLHTYYDIVYRRYDGVSWVSPVFLTNNNFGNYYVNTPFKYYGDKRIHYVWRNGTASPYQIMYDYVSLVDTIPPTYSLNLTNSTLAGTPVMHSLYWQDNFGLSYAIFSFDNCTGSLQNITGMALSGTSAWSNFTVVINSTVGCTIRWCIYANDTSNNWNGTSCLQPFSYVTTPAAVPQVYERNISISFTQGFSTARSANMQRDLSQYVYLPVQFNRYAAVGRFGETSISAITEFLRNSLYTRDFSTSASIVAELLRNAGYTREALTGISALTEFFRTASYGRSIFTGISALIEFFKLIRPLDYCFEIRRDGSTITCVKDRVFQANCLDIIDINNWLYICELADRLLMVIRL
jgi:hypothetical protein